MVVFPLSKVEKHRKKWLSYQKLLMPHLMTNLNFKVAITTIWATSLFISPFHINEAKEWAIVSLHWQHQTPFCFSGRNIYQYGDDNFIDEKFIMYGFPICSREFNPQAVNSFEMSPGIASGQGPKQTTLPNSRSRSFLCSYFMGDTRSALNSDQWQCQN